MAHAEVAASDTATTAALAAEQADLTAAAAADALAEAAQRRLAEAAGAAAAAKAEGGSLTQRIKAAVERATKLASEEKTIARHTADAEARLREAHAQHSEAVALYTLAAGRVPPERLRA